MSDKDLETQEKNESTSPTLENNVGGSTSKGSVMHYFTINLIDAVFSAVITVILAFIAIFALRAMGYTIVSEAYTAFILIIFVIVYILYKSIAPASKSGETIEEKMVK